MRRPPVQNTNKLIKAIAINEKSLPNIIRKARQLLSFPYKTNTKAPLTPLKIIQKIQKIQTNQKILKIQKRQIPKPRMA